MEIQQPKDSFLAHALYNKKYGGPVYKFQNVVDFLGRIVAFTGVHLGKTHDAEIWSTTALVHPLHPEELVLGDKAYIAEPQVLVPHRFPPNLHLLYHQYVTNRILSHYRARVEHSNARLKKHKILSGKYRGKTMEMLSFAGITIANISNVHQRNHLSYEPYGPHPHF